MAPRYSVAVAAEGVHIWQMSSDQPADCIGRLQRILSPEERSRADRFRVERERRQFIVSHSLLRLLLAWYLGCEPEAIGFAHGPNGKPYLATPPSARVLQFSLSHSHEAVLLAFTRGYAVGIDLEYMRPLPEYELLVSRLCSPGEQAALRTLPEEQRLAAFFRCWTRKEAYLKATGEGLARELATFSVPLLPDDPPRLHVYGAGVAAGSRWSLHSVDPGPDYQGALVVAGHVRRLLHRQLQWDASGSAMDGSGGQLWPPLVVTRGSAAGSESRPGTADAVPTLSA